MNNQRPLTREKILSLSPGSELNELVAGHVFKLIRVTGEAVNWRSEHPENTHKDVPIEAQEIWIDEDGMRKYCKHCGDMPGYSEYIEPAWCVIEEANKQGYDLVIYCCGKGVEVQFDKAIHGRGIVVYEGTEANTAPEAIVKAVLLAYAGVECEVQECVGIDFVELGGKKS